MFDSQTKIGYNTRRIPRKDRCMDRKQMTQDYCQGNGLVVNGYYGIEQWE